MQFKKKKIKEIGGGGHLNPPKVLYTVAHNGGIFFFIPIYGIILKII